MVFTTGMCSRSASSVTAAAAWLRTAPALVPLAEQLNVDFVWIHVAATVLESTLAHSLNVIGTRCLVVEMGVGMRLTKSYGEQLVDGILNLMHTQGMWAGETKPPRKPIVSKDEVAFINLSSVVQESEMANVLTPAGGIFRRFVEPGQEVEYGQKLGVILDPFTAEVEAEIICPTSGVVFFAFKKPLTTEHEIAFKVIRRLHGGCL